MAVEKATIVQDIWKLFYDRIKAQVTSQLITGNHTITIKSYDSNFSDRPFEDNSYYPVIVISPPTIPDNIFTFGKNRVDGTVTITLYSYQAESADKFASQIFNTIESYRATLAINGLRKIKFSGPEADMVQRGGIKIHMRRLRVDFSYYYNKSGGAF
jgi:hypothetical protein